MKLALSQMKMSGDAQENLAVCLDAIQAAKAKGADLILFPELTLQPFFPQYPRLDVEAVTLDSPEVRAFQAACQEHRIYAVPNFYLELQGHRYDASLLITPEGEIQGVQKMVHVAQAHQFYEQDYYAPSDDGFLVFPTPMGKLAIVVCFDRHYPESIRTARLRGADLILIPTANTRAEPSELFQWEIRVQAFQNCVSVAMCNRVGLEGSMDFSGESIVADGDGNLLALADDTQQILYAEVDLGRPVTRPYLNLRRCEHYL